MMDDLLLAVDVLLGECKGTLQVDQHDGHRRIANTIDKLRARIQQRLDTGGWIAGSIIGASEPFRSVEPTFVGKPIWTWRESDGQWFRHDPLPALPKEK